MIKEGEHDKEDIFNYDFCVGRAEVNRHFMKIWAKDYGL